MDDHLKFLLQRPPRQLDSIVLGLAPYVSEADPEDCEQDDYSAMELLATLAHELRLVALELSTLF